MDEKERLNALEVALNNEMREQEFYLRNAERTRNPLGRKMFQQIGDEELEHYERLKQLHGKWENQEKWPETVPLIVPITLINHYVCKYDQPYLKEQYYLHPHPLELQLRNHV